MILPSPYAPLLDAITVSRRSVRLRGSSTELWVYGPADAGTTIVMVHGFRGDHHGLEPIVAQLGDFRTVLADLPGFGSSTPLDVPHDIEGYGRWLEALVADVRATGDGGRIVVLGHSFGSIIVSGALAAGLEADRVVLVNPIAAPALSGPRGILTRLAVFYYWLAARLPEKLGFALLRSPLVVRIMSVTMAKTKDAKLRRWIHNQHDRFFSAFSNRAVVLEAFRASVSNDVSMFAESIHTPTLLLAADRDDITPIAAEHTLQTRIAGSRLVVLADVGHLVHYEVPREAAHAIRTFLEDTASEDTASKGTTPGEQQ
jgi:pimeloyl-ACP methyl ester carboxylesterase